VHAAEKAAPAITSHRQGFMTDGRAERFGLSIPFSKSIAPARDYVLCCDRTGITVTCPVPSGQ
jgi:hypothetical protein